MICEQTVTLVLFICCLQKCNVISRLLTKPDPRTYLLTDCREAVEELYSVHHKLV